MHVLFHSPSGKLLFPHLHLHDQRLQIGCPDQFPQLVIPAAVGRAEIKPADHGPDFIIGASVLPGDEAAGLFLLQDILPDAHGVVSLQYQVIPDERSFSRFIPLGDAADAYVVHFNGPRLFAATIRAAAAGQRVILQVKLDCVQQVLHGRACVDIIVIYFPVGL